jgi:hypothetical protein
MLHLRAHLLHFSVLSNVPTIWYVGDDSPDRERHDFLILRTGDLWPDNFPYWLTYDDNGFLWHVFHKKPYVAPVNET